ncbi:MAG: putative hemolysin [Ignavibacteria bacterium]|nr:MAG: putative hemolysin [Ignavibacteria bacterium]KAF0161093.1 MAG: putative hemolysin [Ignavibacteria bacterium]
MEILIIAALILLNGFFAMSEIAIVSSRKSKLDTLSKSGNKGAKTALKLLEHPENFLSAVQIGITLIGIVSGAYGGTALADDLVPYFEKFDGLKAYSNELAFIIVVGMITYFSLIIGELVPKTLAFNNPERLASFAAPIMSLLAAATKPIIWFLTISTKLFLKILFIKQNKENPITEEELKYLLEQGTIHGTFEKYETEIIKSIFRFGDRKASSIMTQRQDIVIVDINLSTEKITEIIDKNGKRIYPVCDGSLDKLIGIIDSSEYLLEALKKQNFQIKDILYHPIYIPESVRALKVIEKFRYAQKHFAVVIDEHGSAIGVITLHDIIENILGDLPEKDDEEEVPQIVERKDGSYLVDGIIMVDELNDKLKTNIQLADKGFVTLGGFIMDKIGKIPKAGDNFIYNDFYYEVVDMDDKRVDKVLVKRN